jgi:N-acetylneuraminate synthase
MIIERDTSAYRVFSEDSILKALEKMSANKSGFVLVVSDSGRVQGTVTDGDIRRWMTAGDAIDVNKSILSIANSKFTELPFSSSREQIEQKFDTKVKFLPLVDEYKHLIAVARAGHRSLSIAGREIGPDSPCYIISEIGNNHNGDFDLAKRLVDLSSESGVDCVKFQMRDLKTLYSSRGNPNDASQDLGAQYTLDLLIRFNLPCDDLFRLFDYCFDKGVTPLCTPWEEVSLRALERYGLPGYKVASADFTNTDLILEMARTGKPLIASTGMSNEAEIRSSINLLRQEGAAFALLHCNSTYPAPYKDVNLAYMNHLKELGDCPVGYSGHERGWFVPVAAVALGAKIIEKHFTVDRSMEGNDHRVSLLPNEMRDMVDAIRCTELSMGSSDERSITQGEMMNREVLAKSLHAAVDICPGTIITDDQILVQSPGQGLQPNQRGLLVGRTAKREVRAGTPFFPSDIVDNAAVPRAFNFSRPWGIPVRYHDYRAMLNAAPIPFLEYHLSYKDLEEDLCIWFSEQLPIQYAVHSPELFSGDHVLDLASKDDSYRARSISELQRVIDITRALKKWHNGTERPLIITNMGGFDSKGFIPREERAPFYDRIVDSLSKLDREGVEIIPQTMPPFPWHFGGQSHHNLFMDPDEIMSFCKANEMRICLDLSHSQLACNYFGWSMSEFCEKVGPYVAHLHVVDAKGVDGEGLQIGEGAMDFAALARVLNVTAPDASFIPEIWQGHKNGGAGFWFALDRLEPWFGVGTSPS